MTEIREEDESFLVESDTQPIIENEPASTANKERNGMFLFLVFLRNTFVLPGWNIIYLGILQKYSKHFKKLTHDFFPTYTYLIIKAL